jgi:predicted Zn-dependent peptidase
VLSTFDHIYTHFQWKYLAHAVTDEEVRRAKNQLTTNVLSQLENNAALANHVATGVLSMN